MREFIACRKSCSVRQLGSIDRRCDAFLDELCGRRLIVVRGECNNYMGDAMIPIVEMVIHL